MLSDAQWARLEPLIEICRPKGKTPPQDLRRTHSAILWRHQNGAKWRSIPEELGPGGERPRSSSAQRKPAPA
jgi:transposase